MDKISRRFSRLLTCVSALLLLAACGQKGPLYMPDTPDKNPPQQEKPQEG